MPTPSEFDEKKVEELFKAGKEEEAQAYRDECLSQAGEDSAKRTEIQARYEEIHAASASAGPPPAPAEPAELVVEASSVGEVTGEVKKLEPIQRAGLYLAAGVGAVIAVVTITVIVKWIYTSPWTGVPSNLSNMPGEQAKALVENIKSLSDVAADRCVKIFDAIVVRALLPVFTSILGYIFGTRTLASKSSTDTE
jgi:hypothetical protein